eukprot:scaffold4470_cov255-Prasinococcus_capsulatus_cf.AAC.24
MRSSKLLVARPLSSRGALYSCSLGLGHGCSPASYAERKRGSDAGHGGGVTQRGIPRGPHGHCTNRASSTDSGLAAPVGTARGAQEEPATCGCQDGLHQHSGGDDHWRGGHGPTERADAVHVLVASGMRL